MWTERKYRLSYTPEPPTKPFVLEDLNHQEVSMAMDVLVRYDRFLEDMGLLQSGGGSGSGFAHEMQIEIQKEGKK